MSFTPKFKWVTSVDECADAINAPHEDYPSKVLATKTILNLLIENKTVSISSFEARQIHNVIFSGHYFAGRWRHINIRVGQDTPPDWIHVDTLIEKLFPVTNQIDLMEWYKQFQLIHPFQDGNGRVCGVICAVLSWDGEKMLAPLQ